MNGRPTQTTLRAPWRQGSTLLVVLVWTLTLCACDGQNDVASDPTTCATFNNLSIDATGGDVATEDGGSDSGGSDSGVTTWQLDPCAVACDRAIACSAAQCKGYDWTSVGPLYVSCASTCAKQALPIGAATSCGDAVAALSARISDFSATCKSNPCVNACTKVADCVVNTCEKIGATSKPNLISGCVNTCKPATIAWVMGAKSCGELIDAITNNDATFSENCHGKPQQSCPDSKLCDPYGKKLADCMVQHCGKALKPYEIGLAAALSGYCAGDAKCPTTAAVQGVLASTVTCSSPGLSNFGDAAPFSQLCQDKVGVSFDALTGVCTPLVACPGTEWLTSVDVCRVLFALRTDAAVRVKCLQSATDCKARYACLEGL